MRPSEMSLNMLLLISIHGSSIDACWTDTTYIPPVINPGIIDNVLLPPLPNKDFQLFEEYMKKLPWTNNEAGESQWPGPACKSGRRQSPINIEVWKTVRDFSREFIKYGPLKFQNYDVYLPAIAFNNGNTLQFISQAENATDPSVTGGPLDRLYRLEQVHYHWPSEHAIDGHKFAMEIHFVHVRHDLDVQAALKAENGLAILAVFWNIYMGWKEQLLNVADFDYFYKLAKPGTQIKDVELNIGALIRTNHKAYFTYSGSLSSPHCEEAVIWIVFETPVWVPETLYRSFGILGVLRNNFRPLKRINNRKVFRTPHHPIMTPLLADTFSDFDRVFNGLVKNYTKMAYRITGRVAKAGKKTLYKLREDSGEYEINRNRNVETDNEHMKNEETQTEKTSTGEKEDLEIYKTVEDVTRRQAQGPVNNISDIEDLNDDGEENDTKRSDWSLSIEPIDVDTENQQNMDFDNLVQQ